MLCLFQAGASGSKPHHSGRHIELSDTEVDAVAAFPTFRHAVKSKRWEGNSDDAASEDDDEDDGMFGYGYEGEELATLQELSWESRLLQPQSPCIRSAFAALPLVLR